MATKQVSDFPQTSTLVDADLIHLKKDGTGIDNKMTIADFKTQTGIGTTSDLANDTPLRSEKAVSGTIDLIKGDTSDNVEVGNSTAETKVVFDTAFRVNNGTNDQILVNDGGSAEIYYNNGGGIKTQSATASDNASGAEVVDAGGVTYRSIGFNVIPPFEFSTTSEILTKARIGYILEYSGSGGHTVTTEDNTDDLDIPVGATWMVSNNGTATVAINQGTSVTLRWLDGGGAAPSTGNRTLAIAGIATITKISDAEYRIFGAGLS